MQVVRHLLMLTARQAILPTVAVYFSNRGLCHKQVSSVVCACVVFAGSFFVRFDR